MYIYIYNKLYFFFPIFFTIFIHPAASQKLIFTIKDFDKCKTLTIQSLFPLYVIKNIGSLARKRNWLR